MNFLKQTSEPCRSVQKNTRVPPVDERFLRPKGIAAGSEEGEIAVELPLRYGVVVIPPLRLLELDIGLLERRSHHQLAQRVGIESLDRFEQRAREGRYAHRTQLGVGLQVHVVGDR